MGVSSTGYSSIVEGVVLSDISQLFQQQEDGRAHLVVEVVEVAGDEHVDVPHDLQHVQALTTRDKMVRCSARQTGNPGGLVLSTHVIRMYVTMWKMERIRTSIYIYIYIYIYIQ